MIYASRLVSRQGTDYATCSKVYSIWIVSNPENKEAENTAVRLVVAQKHPDGSYTDAPDSARMIEIWFLNLGDPDDERLSSPLLHMLDVAFSEKITAQKKIKTLRDELGLRMSTQITGNLEAMRDMELAIEKRAREEGRKGGVDEGIVRATLNMARIADLPAAAVPALMNANFDGDSERAQRALEAYLRDHPEETDWLKSAD